METFQENFDLVDEDKDGLITKEEATTLFRGLGQTPTESEMKELLHGLPAAVSFDAFCTWFSAGYKDPSSELAITKAFRVFDLSNSGVLPLSKFRELLTSLGDPMSKEEVCSFLLCVLLFCRQIEEIIQEIPVDSRGNFDYVVFARKLVEGPKGCPHLISKSN